MICDYYINKTDLADLSSFNSKKNWKFSQQIPKYLLPLESGNLQLEQTEFPVFWQNVQIPCVFPDREFIWLFSLFSLCSGYPDFRLKNPISCFKLYLPQLSVGLDLSVGLPLLPVKALLHLGQNQLGVLQLVPGVPGLVQEALRDGRRQLTDLS